MKAGIVIIWNAVTTVLVGLVVLLAVLLVGARLVGFQVFAVLSGSMEPTYHVGSVIYVRKTPTEEITEGDPITFMLDADTVATHRVVEVVPDAEDPSVVWFRTKGDANTSPDGALVHCRNVLGVPKFSIPYLGYVAHYIQHPPGMYVALAAGAVLFALVFLPDLLFGTDDSSGKKPRRKHRAGDAPVSQ